MSESTVVAALYHFARLENYEEIILIGSGKGVVSVSQIENTSWKRKSLKIYDRLFKIYNNQIFYS